MRELADEELMELARDANAQAFEVVYDRHADAAFSLAYRICGQRQLAEEVVQDAFLTLWRSGARYDRARGSVRSWILGIVHNRAIDALRRVAVRDRGRVSDDGLEARVPAPERTDLQVLADQQGREIRAALAALPDEQRRVIELAYFGGLTHAEVANALAMPLGTVKGRMRLGLAKLRVSLGEAEEVLG